MISSWSPPTGAPIARQRGFHNLRANAAVEIRITRVRRTATAIVVEPSDPDFSRLWKIVSGSNPDRHSAYQKQTARAIPVIVVRPT
jgi:deazaflavin-dependent oxidoreductase (nitroreductase family)